MLSKVSTGIAVSLLMLAGTIGTSHGQQKPVGGPNPSPPGAAVYFVGLKDGQTVPTTFTVNFGLKGMGVAPAGSDKANAGHHHLLIDTELPPLDQPIPSDFNHLHFGAGQTEAEVTLPEGEHTLQLVLGDKDHIPNTIPLISERIKIRVVAAAQVPAASAAAAAPATTSTCQRGPQEISGRRQGLFRLSEQSRLCLADAGHPLRPDRHGRCTRRLREGQHRSPPSADRYRSAESRPADSRATSIICISAPARPKPRSRCRSASIPCNCCSPTRSMSRTIRRCCRNRSRSTSPPAAVRPRKRKYRKYRRYN